MTRKYSEELKDLVTNTPRGVVWPSAWLRQQGISNKLAWWYVHSGWFEHFGHGAYCLHGAHPSWQGAIYSLQALLGLNVHVGAKTALTLLGRIHYVPMQEIQQIALYCGNGVVLPRWFTQAPQWQEKLVVLGPLLFNSKDEDGLITREIGGYQLKLSSPERAIMEVMGLIPKHQSYQEALLLMENLSNLRPQLTQSLLLSCTSVKVKRLFLHCAEKHNHPWLKDLDVSLVDLGSGPRRIAEGGVFDSKYQLSVPKS